MTEKKQVVRNLEQAKEISRTSYIPIGKELVKDKNYIVSIRALLDNYCKSDKDKHKIISKKDLKSMMRKVFKLQSRKINTVIQTYLDLNILAELDENNYIVNFIKPFVTLDPETVQYCLTTLSDLSFKVYCYLKNMYELKDYYDYKETEFWKFSVTGHNGLLEACGYYSDSSNNRKKMNWILETLQDVGLISISEPFPLQDEEGQFHGWYRYLYAVYDKSNAQKKVQLQEFVEGYIYPEYRYDKPQAPMYVDGKEYLYTKKIFKNKDMTSKLLEDSRNLDTLEFALMVQDVRGKQAEEFDKVIASWNKD